MFISPIFPSLSVYFSLPFSTRKPDATDGRGRGLGGRGGMDGNLGGSWEAGKLAQGLLCDRSIP